MLGALWEERKEWEETGNRDERSPIMQDGRKPAKIDRVGVKIVTNNRHFDLKKNGFLIASKIYNI